jgi:hypothetical protein
MIYPNNRESRDRIINLIERLQAQGYVREDKRNQSVVMKKVVRRGKVLSESKIVRFVFKPEDVAIEMVEESAFNDLDRVKKILFGWSSIEVEASNAVKAGIFNEIDKDILLKSRKQT